MKQLSLKCLLISFMLFIGNGLIAQTAIAPTIGDGSLGSPYQIATLNNLYWIADQNNNIHTDFTGVYFKQTANIDASTTSTWFSGKGWDPIGNGVYIFAGSYDGQGYTISNLHISRATNDYIGLFGYCSAGTIKNTGVTNVSFTGGQYTAGLIGVIEGSVLNCYSTGSIVGLDFSGGFIGYVLGTIDNSYSNCSVARISDGSTHMAYGGFTGTNDGGTITNCYATGTVTGGANTSDLGGFMGSVSNGSITNCYSTGLVTPGGATSYGGFVGGNTGGTVTSCFWDTETSGQSLSAAGTGKTTTEMKTTSTFTGWSSSVWGITTGIYPYLLYQLRVTTQAVTNVAVTTATGNGNIVSLGTSNATAHGVCWNTGGSPTISDSKTDNGTKSSTGTFTASISGLAANTTYHVKAFATNTSGTNYGDEVTFTTLTNGTFTGTTNNDWNTASNWAGGSVPTPSTDVTIPTGKNPVISATTPADCHNLTVVSGGTLTIASTSSGTGSLIVSGTSSGNVTCQNYISGSKWHIISPNASGGNINTFIQAGSNALPVKNVSGTNYYGMMDYNETTNLWKSYFTAATGAVLTSGQGYSIQRTSDGIVTFTGALTSGTKTVTLTKLGAGWNCIGNPYTSAIKMNTAAGSNNFLAANSINLDASYACMYLWDDASSSYKILGNSNYGVRDLNQNIFQSGQGFFVKAKDNTGLTVQFTTAMQVHQPTTAFKSGQISWPGIELTATIVSQAKASAVVTFNAAMTKGLDPTYDAGLLRGSNGISIYTRLVEDNGVDFAFQCLPENGYQNYIIPVGLDYALGGEVKISALLTGLPSGTNVILEDRLNKTFTQLNSSSELKVTVDPNTKGIGRFYLHTTALSANDLKTITLTGKLNAYVSPDNEVRIIGEVSSKAIATLYDAQGKVIRNQNLQESNLNVIPTSTIKTGIYLLSIKDTGKLQSFKLFIKQ